MKKLGLSFICFVGIFANGCIEGFVATDWAADTEIEIINDSSYNLNITFERIPPYSGFDGEIYLLKTETALFYLWSGLGGKDVKPVNPNNERVKIIFLNIDTGVIIKEMENSEYVFTFIKEEPYKAYYQFKISDDLLQ
ncbi:MAG: hypothetical protein FWD82_10255 [Defluviitaleaceae bacterium]|nr:hypothetical protein [Defluviitaleaceae bacterium]